MSIYAALPHNKKKLNFPHLSYHNEDWFLIVITFPPSTTPSATPSAPMSDNTWNQGSDSESDMIRYCDLFVSEKFLREKVLTGRYEISDDDLKEIKKLDLGNADGDCLYLCDNLAEDDGTGRCKYHNQFPGQAPHVDKVAEWIRRGWVTESVLKKQPVGRSRLTAPREAPKDVIATPQLSAPSKEVDGRSFAAAAAAPAAPATAAPATSDDNSNSATAADIRQLLTKFSAFVEGKENELRVADQKLMAIATSPNPTIDGITAAVAEKQRVSAKLDEASKVFAGISAIVGELMAEASADTPAKAAPATAAAQKAAKPKSQSGDATSANAEQRDEMLAAAGKTATKLVITADDWAEV